MIQVEMKLMMADTKKRAKALQAAVGVNGVVSVALGDDKIVVLGDVDSVKLTMVLRKKMGPNVELLSVAEAKKEDKKVDDKGAELAWHNPGYYMLPYPGYPSFMIPEDTYSRGSGCVIL